MIEFSEDSILSAIQSKDEQALITLHQQYANLVFSVAYRILNDTMSAEEVTQDTFMRLWNKCGDIDLHKGRLISWLLMVARCLAIDAFRSRTRKEPRSGMLFMDENPGLWEDILPEGNNVVLRRSLELALDEVPCEQRELIELTFFYKMSHQDIADAFAIPLGTVKTRIRLGMMKLRLAWQMPRECA